MLAVDPRLDSIRGCADAAKACVAWAITSQLTVRVRRWSGGRIEEGTPIDTDLVLAKQYPVRQLRQSEVASSGGVFNTGDIIVEDVTPAYTSHGGGGYTALQLDPSSTLPRPNRDTEILYLLDGAIQGVFSLVSFNVGDDDPTVCALVLRNTRRSP